MLFKLIHSVILLSGFQVSGQLLGQRGLVTLPPGWVYHDNITLAVSKTAGKLAKELEELEKHRESQRLEEKAPEVAPQYGVQGNSYHVGSELAAEKVLAYGDALYFSPPQDTRLNAKLAVLEAERVSGIYLKTPSRFPSRHKPRPLPTSSSPQFESQPLVPERFNRFYSRNRARNSTPSPSFSFNILVQH